MRLKNLKKFTFKTSFFAPHLKNPCIFFAKK